METIFLTSMSGFANAVLGGDEMAVLLLMGLFTVGIGASCMLYEKLSGHKIEIGLVPFGSIGMTLFAVDLYFASRGLAPGGALVSVGTFVQKWAHIREGLYIVSAVRYAGLIVVVGALHARLCALVLPISQSLDHVRKHSR
ncbi:MAG: hypothetical protein ING75_04095 [Rhodocyclaceae bacterium]|nr:hypothetical protein [Rhodocyclaceae bacterium]